MMFGWSVNGPTPKSNPSRYYNTDGKARMGLGFHVNLLWRTFMVRRLEVKM
jgi:hypothetical protein